jgi:hypothetical protein
LHGGVFLLLQVVAAMQYLGPEASVKVTNREATGHLAGYGTPFRSSMVAPEVQ